MVDASRIACDWRETATFAIDAAQLSRFTEPLDCAVPRQAVDSATFDIRVMPAQSVAGGVSALTLASGIVSRTGVEASRSHVDITTPYRNRKEPILHCQ